MLFFVSLLAAAAAQTTVDPSILAGIFGTPPTTPTVEVTVTPTVQPTILVDKDGESCQCVPYYLCDANLNAIDSDNATVTGWGTLDIRFREDDCQESAELCCKNPKKEAESVVLPTDDLSNLQGCGFRNPKGLDFSITGGDGNEALFGEFPWVVALMDASNYSYAGVGVLIHPQVVMTAAHIAHRYTAGSLMARAGEWDTQTMKERLKYQERIVKEIYNHKDFLPKSLKNNAALLLLEQPVQLARHINVICMPHQNQDFDSYKDCVANGWGKDSFGKQGRYSVILKSVEVDMVQRGRCNTLLKRTRLGNSFKLHDSFLCAGGEEGKDTCQGDGGAPLACPTGDGRYTLTGLVSWGIGCGQKDVPAVYTNVPKFRTWVDSKMAEWGLETSGYNA